MELPHLPTTKQPLNKHQKHIKTQNVAKNTQNSINKLLKPLYLY